MNPDNVIRPWLLQAGAPFGAREAYPYRRPDTSTRYESVYFEYRVVRAVPTGGISPLQKDEIVDTYDCESAYQQQWDVTVEVDLYNSPSGWIDLAGCAIGATKEQAFLELFHANNAAFKTKETEVVDLTEYDGDRVDYHHRMTCAFVTWAVYQHKNYNHVVTAVELDDPFTT